MTHKNKYKIWNKKKIKYTKYFFINLKCFKNTYEIFFVSLFLFHKYSSMYVTFSYFKPIKDVEVTEKYDYNIYKNSIKKISHRLHCLTIKSNIKYFNTKINLIVKQYFQNHMKL